MINFAYAQDAAAAVAGGSFSATLIQLGAIFLIFYFLLIRPQQKKIKSHEAMLTAVKKGDKVITGGGVIGKVIDAKEDELEVEIAKDTTIKVMRSTIRDLILPEVKKENNDNKKAKK